MTALQPSDLEVVSGGSNDDCEIGKEKLATFNARVEHLEGTQYWPGFEGLRQHDLADARQYVDWAQQKINRNCFGPKVRKRSRESAAGQQ